MLLAPSSRLGPVILQGGVDILTINTAVDQTVCSAPTLPPACGQDMRNKPITAVLTLLRLLEANKVTSLIVVTNELARHIGQSSVLRLGNELLRAAAVASRCQVGQLMIRRLTLAQQYFHNKQKPGDGDAAWTLCVRRGERGRDAKDAK